MTRKPPVPVLVVTFIAVLLPLSSTPIHAKPPVKIILDTDFGDDGDDLAALAVLHHLANLGEAEILAVGQSNSRWDAPGALIRQPHGRRHSRLSRQRLCLANATMVKSIS